MILRTLQKIEAEGAKGVLVVPYWPAQAWFPVYQSLLISKPIYLHPDKNLLKSPLRNHHPMWKNITLVAGILLKKLT